MIKVLTRIMVSFLPIIFGFNLLSLVVGIVWLLIIGKWQIVLVGIFIQVILPFVYGLCLLPFAFIFTSLAKVFHRKNYRICAIVSLLPMSIIHQIIQVSWGVIVFTSMISIAEESKSNIFPYIFFGYSIAVSSFAFLASKERDNAVSQLIVYLSEFSYILIFILYLLKLPFLYLPIIIVLFILLNYIIVSIMNYDFSNEFNDV